MIRFNDVHKEYKSGQNEKQSQFNRYTSNKHMKKLRKGKHADAKYKENENTVNETIHKKIESKGRVKKSKVRHHKKKKNTHNISF